VLLPPYIALQGSWPQPYGGPSGLRFNAKAGTTYYIAVDTKPVSYTCLWATDKNPKLTPYVGRFLELGLSSVGVFRFATEDVDVTGNLYNGNPLLLYNARNRDGSAGVGNSGCEAVSDHVQHLLQL